MSISMILYVVIAILSLLVLIVNAKEVRKCSPNKWDSVKFILWSPLLFVTFVVIILTLPLGILIQKLLDIILKFKFGDEYCGLVKGTDLTMGCNNWQQSFIKSFFIVEYNKTIATKTFFEYTKELMEKSRGRNVFQNKFFATLDRYFGYLFFKKINVEISDCVRQMPLSENVLDKNELIRVLRRCMFGPLPLDGTALWDIQIGTQNLKWKSNSDPNIEYYPMLIRSHHSIADGASLIKLMKIVFEDETNDENLETDVFANFKPKKMPFIRNFLKMICDFFNIFIMFISAMYITLFLKGHDHNDLHGKPFRNEDFFQFSIDEDGTYFKKVKKIKKLHGNIAFSEILISAYSASLNEYFQTHSSKCPESITLALPIILDYGHLKGVTSGSVETVTVTNNFIFLQMHLPLDVTKYKEYDPKTPSISRLNIIRTVTKNLRSTSQQQFSYILIHLFLGSLPVSVARIFLKTIDSTSAGSFLPGPSKFSYCNGALTISDCLFWLTHIIQIGLAFTSLTFNDRLQMGISCNGQVPEQSHIDEILNNVFKHLNLIEQEFESYFKIE
ncbi:hypothetical protein RN001_009836 [Aquatica leii]|uniref:O-acyltransferase WSD1 C-terminal domain-containing protein n=1 Tax=Aquatica leii TaxID=1421715 RepID=A0AAN7P037_9COLE|nr:hypothetical protein RN001_009836 [Aquatica leii]